MFPNKLAISWFDTISIFLVLLIPNLTNLLPISDNNPAFIVTS